MQDAKVIERHVLRRLGQQILVVMGYSWSTVFTLVLVQAHPELFHAWVGLGVSGGAAVGPRRDVLHERLMETARNAADTQALRELTALAPGATSGPQGIDRALALRLWARRYDGGSCTASCFMLASYLAAAIGATHRSIADATRAQRARRTGRSRRWVRMGDTPVDGDETAIRAT